MSDPTALLHTPLGQAGSGRVRYGAAMALWRAGQIGPDVLEMYRIASADDGHDVRGLLRERGLPVPPPLVTQSPKRRLYEAAREYLLKLKHPGAAEVRAGLPVDPGPERDSAFALTNGVVARWLGPSLDALAADRPDLAAAIAGAAEALAWVTYDSYPRDQIGAAFANSHAFTSILGGDAPFLADDFELGLFLIAPGTLYRDRHHRAPELYAPLTGPHGWRFGPGRPLMIKPAHQPVWNPPDRPHLTLVGAQPFLAFFVWTRDVNEPARVIPAADWTLLEGMKIG